MKGSIFSRRSLLAGAGYAIAGTTAGQMLLSVARAQEAAPASSGLCMTMMFMAGSRAKLEADKYAKKHLPLLREVYGDSVERIELRTSTGSAMGVPSPILGTSALWIRDVGRFSQQLSANADRINKDLDSVARGNRLVQVDQIALEIGEARTEVTQNNQVFSLFYPAAAPQARGGDGRGGPGGGGRGGNRGAPADAPAAAAGEAGSAPAFDARYFVEVYLPKLYSLYGSNAVRRIEATLGQTQGGQSATHVGAYHLMIRDRGEYDRKMNSVFAEMQKDAGKFTSIFPILADMRVNAIA